jgi:hypothetical protein
VRPERRPDAEAPFGARAAHFGVVSTFVGELSTLDFVRALPLLRILFALLAFQLAIGLQFSVARAAAVDSAQPASVQATTGGIVDARAMRDRDVDVEQCPSHSKATSKHDCCRSSGCQCQCANSPASLGLLTIRSVPAASALRRDFSVRFVGARAEAHFRPPIVS